MPITSNANAHQAPIYHIWIPISITQLFYYQHIGIKASSPVSMQPGVGEGRLQKGPARPAPVVRLDEVPEDMDDEDVYIMQREFNDMHMNHNTKQLYVLGLKAMLQVRQCHAGVNGLVTKTLSIVVQCVWLLVCCHN